MKGEHEESGSPRLASLREGIQVIQENHERLLIRADQYYILITEMSLCDVVGGVVLCQLLNFIFKEEERRGEESLAELL